MYRIIFREPDFITIIFTIKSVNTYSHISANNKFHTVISTPWNFLESLASLPLVQESFLQRLKYWNGYPGLLFEVSLFPVRRIVPSSAGDNNLSDEDVVPIFRGKLYTSVRVHSRKFSTLFVSIFEDETKFRLLFDRSIVSLLQEQDTDTSFFPSRWIEERNFSGEFNLNITELLRWIFCTDRWMTKLWGVGVNFKISKKETYLLSVPSTNRNAARKIVGITVNVIYMLVPMHFALNSLTDCFRNNSSN